ncbi:hypothetical protein Hanom_Chr04g00314561 [Helianthus anomalus]
MDGVNAPDKNSKISNRLDLDAEKQTFGRKSQNWPNLMKIIFIIDYTYDSTSKRKKYIHAH